MRAAFGAAAILLSAVAHEAAAEPPQLVFPLGCVLGDTCYIEDYHDRRPGPGFQDFACGLKSRDDHRGTDFALVTHHWREDRVEVRAAAAGRVRAVRDGVEDRPYSTDSGFSVDGIECGNAVAIRHDDGWETLYCHMRNGSVAVQPGDTVAPGARLGDIGMSGQSNFPHLHLAVMHDGARVDPFAPEAIDGCVSEPGPGLWQDAPAYIEAGLFDAGFAPAIPDFEAVQTGAARHKTLSPGDAALVIYGHAFHPADGDVMHLRIDGPEGLVIDKRVVLEDPQAQLFRAVGRKTPPGGWAPGLYRGTVHLLRGGKIIGARLPEVIIAAP